MTTDKRTNPTVNRPQFSVFIPLSFSVSKSGYINRSISTSNPCANFSNIFISGKEVPSSQFDKVFVVIDSISASWVCDSPFSVRRLLIFIAMSVIIYHRSFNRRWYLPNSYTQIIHQFIYFDKRKIFFWTLSVRITYIGIFIVPPYKYSTKHWLRMSFIVLVKFFSLSNAILRNTFYLYSNPENTLAAANPSFSLSPQASPNFPPSAGSGGLFIRLLNLAPNNGCCPATASGPSKPGNPS